MAPGAKFSTKTSARRARSLTRASPRSDLRFAVTDFLLALNSKKYQESRPGANPGPGSVKQPGSFGLEQAMHNIDVEVVEVGPRDGLQNLDVVMPTAEKCRWIAAEHAAGVREIEVGSFVPAKLLPQMADTG